MRSPTQLTTSRTRRGNGAAQKSPRRPIGRAQGAARSRAPLLALTGLWLGLSGLLILHQLDRETPSALADELFFGRLAQNLGYGDGYTYRGELHSYRTIYPFLIAPAWAVFKGATAYHVALAINALAMNAVVFPAYAIARRLASWRWALAAAALAAATPAMVWSGMLMTEALAYPLAALALLAMVNALRTPGWRSAVLAFAAVALPATVRAQLLALFPAFAIAIALDTVRFGRDYRSRLRAQLPAITLFAVSGLLAAAVVAVGRRDLLFGSYESVSGRTAGAGEILELAVRYLGVFSVVSLLLPVVALGVLAVRRANWRHAELGPVLAVAVGTSLAIVALAAWSSAVISPEIRERYVFYATPILATCLIAIPGRVRPAAVLAGTAVLSLYLAPLFPGLTATGEWSQYSVETLAPGFFGTQLDFLYPVLQDIHLFAAVTAILGVAASLAPRLSRPDAAVVLVAPTLVFGLGLTHLRQGDANQDSGDFLAQYPRPPDWIERRTDGPVGFVRTEGSPAADVWHFELWNRSVDRAYVLEAFDQSGLGDFCKIRIGSEGALRLEEPCAGRPRVPRYLLFSDPDTRVRLVGARTLYADSRGRALYETSRTPRLRSIVYGCGAGEWAKCSTPMVIRTWAVRRGSRTLELRGRPHSGGRWLLDGRPIDVPRAFKQTLRVRVSLRRGLNVAVLRWRPEGRAGDAPPGPLLRVRFPAPSVD